MFHLVISLVDSCRRARPGLRRVLGVDRNASVRRRARAHHFEAVELARNLEDRAVVRRVLVEAANVAGDILKR